MIATIDRPPTEVVTNNFTDFNERGRVFRFRDFPEDLTETADTHAHYHETPWLKAPLEHLLEDMCEVPLVKGLSLLSYPPKDGEIDMIIFTYLNLRRQLEGDAPCHAANRIFGESYGGFNHRIHLKAKNFSVAWELVDTRRNPYRRTGLHWQFLRREEELGIFTLGQVPALDLLVR